MRRDTPFRAAVAALALAAACKSASPAPDASAPARSESSHPQATAHSPQPTAQPIQPAPPEIASRATLVFAASQAGQLVPCGCSPDQRGGLPRAGALLASLRAKDPALLFIDAGDTLFASATPPSGPAALQARLKARTLAEGDALLAAAAHVLGARDLAGGPGFLAAAAGGVPLLDAGGAQVEGARATLLFSLGAGELKVGLFAAGLGDAPERTIEARAQLLRREGARLVVMVAHPRGERALQDAGKLLPAARAAGVDLVVLGRRDDPASDPSIVEPDTPPLLALEGHGQVLLRLDLAVPRDAPQRAPLFLARGAAGKADELRELDARIGLTRDRAAAAAPELRALLEGKLAELQTRRTAVQARVEAAPPGAIIATATFLPLDEAVGEEPRVRALVARYDAQVAEQNLAEAKKLPASCPRPARGEPAFTGVSARVDGKSTCATCHPGEAAFWQRTGHARAYDTLVAVKKQFSLDCVRCHVTGWQQPGGVCRIDRTDAGGPGLHLNNTDTGTVSALGRRDVQCEMCHGPASEHVKDLPGHIEVEIREQTCRRCHEPENSPRFDYVKYRPFIVGPGHGEPLGKGRAPVSRGELDTGKAGPNDLAKATP